jgi:tetratricopeptide (TPR) repeat protein
MSQRNHYPVKPIVAVVGALALWVAALNASARQEAPQGQPEGAKPHAVGAAQDAPAPAEAAPQEPVPTEPVPTEPAATEPAATEPAPETQPEDAKDEYAEPMVAERLYELAQARLREANVTEPMWRQAAALLQAAAKMTPRDPRFPRLLVEARLKVGDPEGAIAALTAYRKVDPADRVAQIQLIDLYAEQMQTADARLEYLRDLLGRESIPPEVRSHVAAACVPLLLERSQEDAESMIRQALELFPLNPEALRWQYQLLPQDAAPAQRAAVLTAMLRSNPAQPGVATDLADVIASAGLAKESLEWYSIALRLYPRMGLPYPGGFVADAGTALLLSGQSQPLDAMLAAYIQARPGDADAWFLRLVKEKAAAQKLDRKLIDEAWNALSGNLAEVCAAVGGSGNAGAAPPPAAPPASAAPVVPAVPGAPPSAAAAPTTRPTATAADAMAAAKRVKAGESPDLRPALVAALSDLAWLELFFAEDADAAANWVGALRELLPADDVTLARSEGWLDLLAGRTQQARTRLGAVSETDPLAAIGMVRLSSKDAGGEAEAAELAKRLLSNYRTGLAGAMVWSAFRDRGIKTPEHGGAADLRAELDKFPRDWMQILDKPDAYYEVGADVVKVAHRFHEPMFGRITIRNKTDYDLTIGTGGVIRPDLWFDAKITGLVNRNFPGVAYDRIARQVVLRARESTVQYVRIDQGALAATLEENPSASAQVNASVVLNPSPTTAGVGPGPAGVRKSFGKSLVRSGFALTQSVARRRLTAQLSGGAPPERVLALDLLAAYFRLLAQQKELDPAMRALGSDFIAAIAASRNDPSKPVAIWATYLTARISPDERPAAIDALLANQGWPARLLAVLAAVDLGSERQAEIATRLAEGDADPSVKGFAAATLDVLRSQPTTQPATADADAAPARAREGTGTSGPTLPTEEPTPVR